MAAPDKSREMPVLLALATHLALCQGQGQGLKPALSWVPIPSLFSMKPVTEKYCLKREKVSLGECASLCSNEPQCSSFFHRHDGPKLDCWLASTVFTDNTTLSQGFTGYRYYQLYDENCSVDKCYNKLREEDMCLMFIKHHTELNRNGSAALCNAVGGRLPILDTKEKNKVFKAMLESNTVPQPMPKGPFLGARYKENRYLWDDDQEVADDASDEGDWLSGDPQEPDTNSCIKMNKIDQHNRVFRWQAATCISLTKFIMCEKNKN